MPDLQNPKNTEQLAVSDYIAHLITALREARIATSLLDVDGRRDNTLKLIDDALALPVPVTVALPTLRLSPMEKTVLGQMQLGLSSKEIAANLRVAPVTVAVHIHNLCKRNKFKSSRDLLARLRDFKF